ncbi:MAG TPA: hypothetical protein VL990_15360 [Acidobacteriaceae bacterium]|nr:hypothetical protein [Acidobacteriaceae bacterium]
MRKAREAIYSDYRIRHVDASLAEGDYQLSVNGTILPAHFEHGGWTVEGPGTPA